MRVGNDELLSIVRFAQLTGLTAKALRHYDEVGLLRPAYVDDFTGYRWYALDQARDAVAIRRLRSFELPLDEIAEVLGDEELVPARRVDYRVQDVPELVLAAIHRPARLGELPIPELIGRTASWAFANG